MFVPESKLAWTKKSSILVQLKKQLWVFLQSTHNGEQIKNLKKILKTDFLMGLNSKG